MPQMAPMNWVLLLLYFTFMIILFNIMNYYIFFYSIKTFKLKKMNKINWKW